MSRFLESRKNTMLSFWRWKADGRKKESSGSNPKIKTEESTRNLRKSWDKRSDNGGPGKNSSKGKSTSGKGKIKNLILSSKKWNQTQIDSTSTLNSLTMPSKGSTKRTKWALWTTPESEGNSLPNLTDKKISLKQSCACKLTKPKRKWKTSGPNWKTKTKNSKLIWSKRTFNAKTSKIN